MAVFSKILIAYDGSESSRRAAEKAFSIAKQERSEVYGIKVINVGGGLITKDDLLWQNIEKDLREKALATLSELESMAKMKEVNITIQVREGTIESEILNFAKEKGVDLIVMGTTGKTYTQKIFLGSIADRVLREAPCPVMLVR